MEQPVSYYDWEQNYKKKSKKRTVDPKEIRILNSIDLPHDYFKNYVKDWKSKNMNKEE